VNVAYREKVTIAMTCPGQGRVEPPAHRTETQGRHDRFSWDYEPGAESTFVKLRWLGPAGAQDDVVLHWQVR
jgi:hypothetical protein